jgi:hypothetical protein
MKKVFFQLLFLLFSGSAIAQINLTPVQSENLVIGLPKITITQLEFIKGDLAAKEQIKSAEFVFKDYILMIEVDPDIAPALTYTDVENILANYCNRSDIYHKEIDSFKKVKQGYTKVDKFIIK